MSGLAKLALDESERPKIEPDFEEATEGDGVPWLPRSGKQRVSNVRDSAAPLAHLIDLSEASIMRSIRSVPLIRPPRGGHGRVLHREMSDSTTRRRL